MAEHPTEDAKYCKNVRDVMNFLFKGCTKRDSVRVFNELYKALEGSDLFFKSDKNRELGDNLLLCWFETLLNKLRLTSFEEKELCDSIHKLIDLLIHMALTHNSNVLARHLQLFTDLSCVVLTLLDKANVPEYPLELIHFQYDFPKCSYLLPLRCYEPLQVYSNDDIYKLFLHSMRISRIHYRMTRLHLHDWPKFYNMISIRQLWEEVLASHDDIYLGMELLSLGTIVCMTEFSPQQSPHSTRVDELLDLLSMVTGEQIHIQYKNWNDSKIYSRFLDAVSKALDVFKLALAELDRVRDANFFNRLPTHLMDSLISHHSTPLPPPPATIASALSSLLHDSLLFSHSASLSTLSLIDQWHRSPSLYSRDHMSPVLTASLISYSHLRYFDSGFPDKTFDLLTRMSSHHLDKLDEYCSQPLSILCQEELEILTRNLTVLLILLDTSLRLIAATFKARFSADAEDIACYSTQQVFTIDEVNDFCFQVENRLEIFTEALCPQISSLPKAGPPLLLKSCECYGSLVCIFSSKLFRSDTLHPSSIRHGNSPRVLSLLSHAMETLMSFTADANLSDEDCFSISHILQLLAASDKKSHDVGVWYDSLIRRADSSCVPSPLLMQALTSCLPIVLYRLQDQQADSIADHFSALLKRCDLTSSENFPFSLELVTLIPIITSVISYPSLCRVQTEQVPSHSDLPLYTSSYSLSFPRAVSRSELSFFPQQGKDFLELTKSLLCKNGLDVSIQLALFKSLFDLSFFLPINNSFVTTVINFTLLKSNYCLAFQLSQPISDLLQRIESSGALSTENKDCAMLAHPAVNYLIDGLKHVLYKAGSAGIEQKLLVAECYSNLVFSLNKLGRVEEAISVFKLLLRCVFISKEVQEAVSHKINHILTGIGENEASTDTKWYFSAFGAIPEFLVQNILNQDASQEKLTDYLIALNVAFGMEDIGQLLDLMLARLIPLILKMPIDDDKKTALLSFISSHTHTSVSDLIQPNLSNIFPDLAVNAPELLSDRMKFLRTHCTDLSGSLKLVSQDITYKLALNYSLNPEAINDAFKLFQSIVHPTKSPIQMMEQIGVEFLGVLKCLELLNSKTSNKQQLVFIKSLNSLIQLLEPKHINMAPHKLMASLTYFLHHQDVEIVKSSFTAWKSFITHLELPNTDPIWIHIVVTLYQFVCNETTGHLLLPLYENLVSNPELNICGTASYLYSVSPPSTSSHELLKETLNEFRTKIGHLPLDTRLLHIHNGLTHQALIVRKLALNALIHLIETEKWEISRLILSAPFVDRVVANLMQTLVGLFEVKQDDWNIELARCLGALGAVDPVRLKIERERQDTSQLPICMEIATSDKCAIRLLTELATCLATTTAQSEKQDLVSFTIQQVLTAYRMSDSESQMRKIVESSINEHVWAVIQPYLKSRYIMCDERSSSDDFGGTIHSGTQLEYIYMTEKTKTYNHWLSRFCKRLGEFVALPSAKLIFQSCTRLVPQINPRIGFMLLPHMIVQIMKDRNFELSQLGTILDLILGEFESVMNVAQSELEQPSLIQMEANHLKLIIQTILSVLNFLQQLTRKEKSHLNPDQLEALSYISNKLCTLQLAALSEYCNAFPLALRYLEQHIMEEKGNLQDPEHKLLKWLGRLFQQLGDQDSILGLKVLRHDLPSLEESILEHLYEKNISGVTTLYKEGISKEPENTSLRLGLIETQLDLGFLWDADVQLGNLMRKQPEWKTELLPLQVEACWKLSQWEDLDTFVRTDNGNLLDIESTPESIGSARWKLGLGMLLNAAHRRDECEFVKLLDVLRHQRVSFLATHTANSLLNDECYQEVVRLCMLHEVEQGVKTLIFPPSCEDPLHLTDPQLALLQSWEDSLRMTRTSYKVREPMLSLRRGILCISSLPSLSEQVALCDLEVAKLSRRCDLQEPGETALLKVDHFQPTQLLWLQVNYEKAKFLSKFGEGEFSTVKYLEKILSLAEEARPLVPDDILPRWKHFLSKLNLQHLKLLIDNPSCNYTTIRGLLNRLVKYFPDNEKSLFTLAEFEYKLSNDIYKKCNNTDEFQLKHIITLQCLTHYFDLMLKSNKLMRTVMPKAISLWLECSVNNTPKITGISARFQEELNSKVEEYIFKLQPYHFYCAYSILVSRISLTDDNTFRLQAKIIISVMNRYPSICIWLLIGGIFSKNTLRHDRIQSILDINDYFPLNPKAFDKIQQTREATESLVKAFQTFPGIDQSRLERNTRKQKLSTWNQDLYKLNNKQALLNKIVLPIEYCFQFPIDYPDNLDKELPTIVKFTDFCECLSSLKSPKRIRVLGSDKNQYDFLYKSEEDIRKDHRIMEIFRLMNLLMKKDPQCSERCLYIRTYSAVPFSEDTGLLEWVYDMFPIKNILIKLYARADQPITQRDFASAQKAVNESREVVKHRGFNQKFIRRCDPPVFHKWFFDEFPNPTDWYLARKEYTRSTAVMSMVGYIIGLGDRHPENLLISTKTGHLMHVDFGCLFGYGKTLPIPEIVPYRLTHNITDGMGVLNFEGNFRLTCEAVLRCARTEYQTLSPILQNIKFDSSTSKPINYKAESIELVHNRLKGFAEDQKTRLSVEGQVDFTIIEATNPDNLSCMFFGWFPCF